MKVHPSLWKKVLRLLIIILASILLLLWGTSLYLSRHYGLIRTELQKKLPQGVYLDFASLNLNLITQSITVEQLKVRYQPDSLEDNKHTLSISKINVQDISVLKLIFSDKLKIEKISVDSANLILDKQLINSSASAKDSTGSNNKAPALRLVAINDFQLDWLHAVYTDDSTTEFQGNIDLHVSDVEVPIEKGSIQAQKINYQLNKFNLKQASFSPRGSLYRASVAAVTLEKRNVVIDSVVLIPQYEKFEFSRHAGKEIDRLELVVPQVQLNNVNTSLLKNSIFKASGIHIQSANLKAFRDKRLPFIRKKEIPLPVPLFKKISWDVTIDTVQLHDTFISYEEFPEDGDASGTITFEKLDASIFNCTNRPDSSKNEHIDLDVRTLFMGSGQLTASFDFPLHPYGGACHAEGRLSDFDLTAINPALENLAKIKIESGTMNALTFDFSYTNVESTGVAELNYENLKLESLKAKASATVVNKLKTFLANLFIKNDKDGNTPKDKRQGKINFHRNPKRSIFNYWWKSLLSGIKSSYGLEDVIPTKKSED